MSIPEHKEKLLERYHDGEVSSEEAFEVEELLKNEGLALSFLGDLDEIGEFLRDDDAHLSSQVSFENLWDNIQTGIDSQRAADAAALEASLPSTGERLSGWLRAFFGEYKVAWVTAGATAAAVALVMSFMNDNTVQEPSIDSLANNAVNTTPNTGVKVIEKHYIYVDSVDKADPNSTVVVNSMQDDDTAVIWLLPENNQGNKDDNNNDDDSVQIDEEPL